MDTKFLQHILKNMLVQGVDEEQNSFIVLPYEDIIAHELLYIYIAGLFLYNGSVLISKSPSGLWDMTLQSPLLYGFSKIGLIEHLMEEEFKIQGVHCTQKAYKQMTQIQPYFLYIYSIYIPYNAHLHLDTSVNRFIDIVLLKQSILLEPKVFSPLLIQSIDLI